MTTITDKRIKFPIASAAMGVRFRAVDTDIGRGVECRWNGSRCKQFVISHATTGAPTLYERLPPSQWRVSPFMVNAGELAEIERILAEAYPPVIAPVRMFHIELRADASCEGALQFAVAAMMAELNAKYGEESVVVISSGDKEV